MSRARYYISFNAGVTYTEFFPTNTPMITWKREGTEVFMRPRVDKFRIGRTKNPVVYDALYNCFFDSTYFGTDIYYKVNVLGTDKFFFIDPVTSGKIDTQNSVYESTPDPNDEYRDIMAQYEKKWHAGDTVPFNINANVYYPVVDTGAFTNIDFTTFTDIAGHISYTNTSNTEKYARNPLAVTMLTNEVVLVIVSNYVLTSGDDPKIMIVDAAGNQCSNRETVSMDGVYELTASNNNGNRIEISQNDDMGGSAGSLDYIIIHYHGYVSGNEAVYNAINDVLNNIDWMNLGMGVPVSTILWNDALPTGHAVDTPNISTYMTANPNDDYVIEAAANWNDLYIGRADYWTNVTGSLDIATDFEYSLKDVMDLLKAKLRLWWFIDPDGKFRIEHEKYFRDFIPQADLTSYAADKPEVDVKIYSYEKEDVYSQINYKEQNTASEDWIKYPAISYSATLTSNKVKDVTLSLTTDIKCIIDSGADASSSGWVLLRCVPMGANVRLSYDLGTITPTVYYPNVRLSLAYLSANYYDYFAEAESGTVNNAAFTFTHVREFLKQNNIKFRLTTDMDWKKPFTLTEGTGWLDSVEYSPETGMYRIDVGYNPYDVTI